MLYQRFLVVIIHRLFFSWYSFSLVGYRWIYGYVFVGVPTILFYYIEMTEKNVISNKKNGHLQKTTLLLVLFPLVVVLMVIYCAALPY